MTMTLIEADDSDEVPLESRILRTICTYALHDGATRIRFVNSEGKFKVLNWINNEWKNQMKIPLYVWKPVRNFLDGIGGKFGFDLEGKMVYWQSETLDFLLDETIELTIFTLSDSQEEPFQL